MEPKVEEGLGRAGESIVGNVVKNVNKRCSSSFQEEASLELFICLQAEQKKGCCFFTCKSNPKC